MNPRLFFSLPCLFLTACSSSELLPSFQPMQIKSVSIGQPFIDGYAVATFETVNVCDSSKLSEAAVREFFEKSRIISDDERKKLALKGKTSSCHVQGTLELENGRHATWDIDRARMGFLYFAHPATDMAWLYCDTCDSEGNYSMQPGEPERLRPRVKTATIEGSNEFTVEGEPYIPTDSCKKEFTLTPEDVRDFFDVAKPIPFADIEETRSLEQSQCHLLGKAVLQDGSEVGWGIDRFRRGYLILEGETKFYYCADCQSEKYHAPCDIDCVEAINRAKEGYDAPDPETGD